MVVNLKKYVGAGLASVHWGIIDSAGYLQGSETTAPAAGSADGSAMAQLIGAATFPYQPSEPQRPSVEADDGAIARFLFEPTELPAADPVFRSADLDFNAAVLTVLTHDVGGGSFIPIQPFEPTYRDIVWLVVSKAKTILDTGIAEGLSTWEALLVSTTNVFPRGKPTRQTGQANADYTYGLVSNYASQYPWGLALSEGNNGTTKAVGFDFTWEYKPVMERWTGNNILTTYNLVNNIGADSATNIVCFEAGVELTWVTGVPGAGEFGITEGATDTIVFGTAPAADAKIVALLGRA